MDFCGLTSLTSQPSFKFGVPLETYKQFKKIIKSRQKRKKMAAEVPLICYGSSGGFVCPDLIPPFQVEIRIYIQRRTLEIWRLGVLVIGPVQILGRNHFGPVLEEEEEEVEELRIYILHNGRKIRLNFALPHYLHYHTTVDTALNEMTTTQSDMEDSDNSSEGARGVSDSPESGRDSQETFGETVDEWEGVFSKNVSISETSKGGLKYEVILGESKVVTLPRVKSPPLANVKPAISAELIELRINAAAERRQSLEAERLAALALKFRKVEEVAKKKEDGEASFINSTKENLELKMESSIGNRETRFDDLKTKLSTHDEHVEMIRCDQITDGEGVVDYAEK